MKIDVRGLSLLTREASELTLRNNLTPQEQRRFTWLTQQIALLRSGEVTLADLQEQEVNDIAARHGLPQTRAAKSPITAEERAKNEAWKTFINVERENRTATQTEGDILARLGTYSGLGFFVPFSFLQDTYAAMAAHDAFFDEDAVTVLNSSNGRPTTVPLYGDIENEAVEVAEAADTVSSETLIAAPGHAVVSSYSYRSPMWRLSIESAQDVEAMGGYMNIFKRFAADRIARKVGKRLVMGDGVNKPLGIIPALLSTGYTPVTAVGSADNTGLTQDGTNSIGSKDLAALYLSVNEAYRQSPKCAWFMNDNTRLFLSQVVTKQGLPLIEVVNGAETIFKKPVRISPGMDNIGAGNKPILFGDGSHWLTRKVLDDKGDAAYIQLVREAPGLIENGEIALRMFARFDGVLLWNDVNSPAPFGFIQNHT